MTVYIVQEPQTFSKETGLHTTKFDFSAAAEFGDIEVLLNFKAKPWDKSVLDELKHKLQDFGPGDWLILTGNPALMGAAAAIVADLTDGQLRLLQYNGKDRRYLPVVLDVYEDLDMETTNG